MSTLTKIEAGKTVTEFLNDINDNFDNLNIENHDLKKENETK